MASPTSTSVSYTVLYYKRKTHNKVHKSKGVSKVDGILTIHETSSAVVLKEESNGSTVYSSKSLAAVVGTTWKEDDELTIGPYQVEIVSCPTATTTTTTTAAATTSSTSTSGTLKKPTTATTTRTTTRTTTPKGSMSKGGLLRRRPLQPRQPTRPLHNCSNNINNNKRQSHLLLGKPCPTSNNAIQLGKRKLSSLGRGVSSGATNAVAGTTPAAAAVTNCNTATPGNANTQIPLPPPSKKKQLKSHQPLHPLRTRRTRPVSSSAPPETPCTLESSPSQQGPARLPGQPQKNRSTVTVGMVRKRPVPPPPRSNTTSGNSNPPHDKIIPLDSDIDIPRSLDHTLKPHQRTGLNFLWRCLAAERHPRPATSTQQRGCILADEMGLGKTITTIATICALHRQRRGSLFLVVCPSSLVMNWKKECDQWIGKAGQPNRVVLHKGGAETTSKLKALSCTGTTSQILILSYDLFRRNAPVLAHHRTRLLVVDEGHRLKNSAGSLTLSALESLPSEARLLLTATPVQNQLTDFFTLANFCAPGILGPDLATFRRDYERPILAASSSDKKASVPQRQGPQQSEAQRRLDALSSTFVLRRLQKDILKTMLPPRHEVMIFSQPTDYQSKCYQELVGNIGGATTEALTILLQLRKLCLHPQLLLESSQGPPKSSDDTVARQSSKFIVLERLLEELIRVAPEDKIVLVSNFTSALTLIEEMLLKPKEIAYLRLDGSTDLTTRQTLVDTFNRSSTQHSRVFLLSSKAGGCGLNLVGANRLVLIDPDWNPASDIQAMARVYRQGQRKECFLYRLFTTGTVEEVICQRQMQKGSLASRTVDKDTQQSALCPKDLQDCFTLKKKHHKQQQQQWWCDTKDKVGSRWEMYTGPDSLPALGYEDPVLLQTLKKTSTVTFVHYVSAETSGEPPSEESEDSDVNSRSIDAEDNHCSMDQDTLGRSDRRSKNDQNTTKNISDESDSDEEFEFEG